MISIEQVIKEEYADFFEKFPDKVLNLIVKTLKYVTHEKDINEFLMAHAQVRNFEFIEKGLEYLDVAYKVSNKELENIPVSGKVVIVANHPLGAVDALALIKLIGDVRKDIKILANGILTKIENIKDMLIPVDNIRGQLNKTSLLAIEKAMEQEQALIFFPAGEVSRVRLSGVKDGKWKNGFLKIAKRHQAPILPIFIKAKNSVFFYLMSLFWKDFSTFLLPHEMLKFRSKTIEFRIGELIPLESFKNSVNVQNGAKLFRKHLYKIGKGKKGIFITQRCIAHPESRQVLKQELKAAQLLGQTNDGKKIFLIYQKNCPHVLREIGRLREQAFRKVGEGSGKRRDLDEYDTYYGHLLLWDDDNLEIVGAYRLGEGFKILAQKGKQGFYLSSLGEIKDEFIPYLQAGIELGRSFVQPRYWGTRALDYLWLGIGAYLRNHPEVKYLFGPVSISPLYPKASKDALVYYYSTYYKPKNPAFVPHTPYKLSPESQKELKAYFKGSDLKEDFFLLKRYLKQFGLTVPTLYKQYCDVFEWQGVYFHGFGVDNDFGGCVDGYIVANLDKLKPEKRKRYVEQNNSG